MTPVLLKKIPDRAGCAFVCVILAISLLLKLALCWHIHRTCPSTVMRLDSSSYDQSARSIARLGIFSVSPERPDEPQILRTPGYPAFIAAIYLIFGERHASVIIAQILLSIVTAVMMYVMAARLWGRATAASAVLLLALDPVSLSYSELFLTETLFTCLMTLSACVGLHLAVRPRGSWIYALCIGASLSTLVRPIAYWLVFPVLAWLCLFEIAKGRGWKRGLVSCLLLFAPWLALIGGWQLRNFRVTGRAEYCFIANESLLRYRAADIISMRERISFEEAGRRIEELIPDDGRRSLAETLSAHGVAGAAIVKKHPLLFLRSALRGAGKILFVPGEYELLQCLGVAPDKEGCLGDMARLPARRYLMKWAVGIPAVFTAFIASAAYLLLLYAGSLWTVAGIRLRDRGRFFAHLLCLGIVVYLVLLSARPEAGPRFRVPLMPVLCMYAANGLRRVSADS